jgi:hypothetical protein
MEDLDAAELEDVQAVLRHLLRAEQRDAHGRRRLRPGRGARADRAVLRRHPARHGRRPPVECAIRSATCRCEQTVEDRNARLPALWTSYGGVPAGHDDSYALTLLGSILGQGESSRLHQRLVRDEQAALQAQAVPSLRRGPGLFLVLAIANQGVDIDRLEQLLDEEIQRVHARA